ncbi:MAG: methyltransferase domain-containing protein [Methanoregula sp.]|jgi:SAM-dependent methyltransferase|nr:methyltransferase domain-containing protein [Methanoregula sp.]
MAGPYSRDLCIDYLRSFDTFCHDPEEGANYVSDAIGRFKITLDQIPRMSGCVNLLELGSNPYFFTLMVKKKFSYGLTLANYFGTGQPRQGSHVICSEKYDERHVFDFDHFNVEKDVFPYEPESFDIVICCEILEHLLEDPTHMLCEAHRVLKKGGVLILTTPNVKSLANTIKLVFGFNVYGKYSGYGPYGRHNREYLPSEVKTLLEKCGFSEVRVTVKDIYPRPWSLLSRLPFFNGRQDNIFAIAQATGNVTYSYPAFLYQSMPNRIDRS